MDKHNVKMKMTLKIRKEKERKLKLQQNAFTQRKRKLNAARGKINSSCVNELINKLKRLEINTRGLKALAESTTEDIKNLYGLHEHINSLEEDAENLKTTIHILQHGDKIYDKEYSILREYFEEELQPKEPVNENVNLNVARPNVARLNVAQPVNEPKDFDDLLASFVNKLKL